MDWNGVLQGLFSNLVWWIIIVVGGGLLALLKVKWPRIAGPALYGLLGVACLATVCFVAVGRPLLSKEQPQTTTENVDANIRAWADSLGMGVTRFQLPDAYFALGITLKNGNQVVIGRVKERPSYLEIQSSLILSPEHQAILSKLTKEQAADVTEEVTLELARSKIGYTITGPPPGQMQTVLLQRSVPITSGLTEATFGGYLDEMDSAISLVRLATTLALAHNSQPPKLHLQ